MARQHDTGSRSSGDPVSRNGLLTLKAFSVWAGIPVPTLRRWIRNGLIPFLQPGGRGGAIYVPLDALERTTPACESSTSQRAVSRPRSGPRPQWQSH